MGNQYTENDTSKNIILVYFVIFISVFQTKNIDTTKGGNTRQPIKCILLVYKYIRYQTFYNYVTTILNITLYGTS